MGLFYLEPGSLGTDDQPTWEYQNFPTAQAAVTFLNDPARQGLGEASATPRSDGSVGVFYLEPGSLGTDTRPTWVFQNFPNPQDAVTFLNDPARQGPGQVSAVARNDGSVGLLFLEPGSLGTSTSHAWAFKDFAGPDGTAAAAAFLNATPRQGPRETSAFARNDGSVSLFYLEPGTG